MTDMPKADRPRGDLRARLFGIGAAFVFTATTVAMLSL